MISISVYYISLIITLSYIMIKKRKFDLFTLSFICGIFYSSPLFFGTVYDPEVRMFVDIVAEVYIFYGLFFLFLCIGAIIVDKKYKNNYILEVNFDIYFKVLALFVGLLLVIMFLKNPYFLFVAGEDKADVGQFGFIYSFFIWGTMILISLSVINNNKLQIFIAFSFVFISLLIGSRSYMAISLLMYVMIKLQREGNIRLILQYKYIFYGLFLFIFLFVYKIIFKALRAFDLNTLTELLYDNSQYIYRVFQGGEANLIMANLNNAFQYYDKINSEYIINTCFKFIPFLSQEVAYVFNYKVERFSNVLKDDFYSHINYGMGANFWAELFYIGGWLLLFIGLCLYIYTLYVAISLFYSKKAIRLFVFLFPSFMYMAFYIHRLEIGFLNYSLFITIFYYFIFIIMFQIILNKKFRYWVSFSIDRNDIYRRIIK